MYPVPSTPIHGVLFDLDGTLLRLDLRRFLGRYFEALGVVLASVAGESCASEALEAVLDATGAMSAPHDGLTNREAFDRRFDELTGLDIASFHPALDAFYEETFPGLQGDSGPAPGARRAVETALGLGLRVAVATNPIFPLRAIEHRIAWAGLGDLGAHVVTSYETMRACKPHAAYYRQTAEMLGAEPTRCIMVGDDPTLDMPAADVGMLTFRIGDERGVADFSGDLDALADLLPRLAAG